MKAILLTILTILTLAVISAFAQSVSGTVAAEEDGSPLPGVSVIIKGTSTGAATDENGRYELTVPDIRTSVLVFSYVGYSSVEVPINGRTQVNVVLSPDLQQLQEIVVTALGIERSQKALGYAVSRLSSEELTKTANTNFASALYGKAPGIKVTTAPGGATSAVNVQIRGINSMTAGSNQPLYVVDGVIIRNLTEPGLNNGGYWDDQKIRGNGILDINPADIESLTILKGAGAAALYGSDASNGVIVITTKKGRQGRGLGVDFNYSYTVEEVAFTPKYQNIYGPGYDRETNMGSFGSNEEGFIPVDLDGDGTFEAERPIFRAWGQFGPKMDGRTVAWWDGTMRQYLPQPDNYKEFYETGGSSIANIALSNSSQSAAYRFSYTRQDYKSIAPGSHSYRNNFHLNSTISLHDRISVDLIGNYVNSYVHNRPEAINRIMANYGGFFSRADYMDVYLNKYKTSEGYKYVPPEALQRNPEEAIKYSIRAYDLLEYLWRNVHDRDDEFQDRLLTSVTLNYQIFKNLRLRGRVGNDFTKFNQEIKRHNEYPIAFNGTNSTGSYTVNQGSYSNLYGDVLLSFSQDISSDFKVGLTGGLQSRSQNYLDQSSSTRDGLIEENWFSLSNSFNANLNTSSSRIKSLMYAYLGILNLSYRDFLFLETTGRIEYHSALPPHNNRYFYPSVNSGFVFTEAFRLPTFINYGKLRAAYASVSNPPEAYRAPISYTQTVLSAGNRSVAELRAGSEYGNDNIKPERKNELEIGLEARFFKNRLAVDVAYYSNTVRDQIILLSLPRSTGAISRLENLGKIGSKGFEALIYATPYVFGNVQWDTRLGFSTNRTKVNKLVEGMDEIVFYNGDGGAILVKAEEGEKLGTIYAHPKMTDANGNYIVGDDGLYVLSSDYVKVGDFQPKAVGGWANTISYKGFSLDFMIDYRFGGKIVSPPLLYAYGAGMFESTLKYRDEEHGGLPYNIDEDGKKVRASSHATAQYHDGVLLEGVTLSGEPNTTIVDAASYYINSFYWSTGRYEDGAVFKNDYIKMREVALTYRFPTALAEKLRFQNISVSLIGRNLFYLYRTLENLDPEAMIGTRWDRQNIDEGSMAASRSYGIALNLAF